MKIIAYIGALIALVGLTACEPVGCKSGKTETTTTIQASILISDPDHACTADYANKMWDICGVKFPSQTEDGYTVKWTDGVWYVNVTPEPSAS